MAKKEVLCTLSVEERISKNEKPYKALVANIDGVVVRICFFDVYTELAFLRAGVDFLGQGGAK
jgi:hypothetical protein